MRISASYFLIIVIFPCPSNILSAQRSLSCFDQGSQPYILTSEVLIGGFFFLLSIVAPFTGVMLADYLVVRRCITKLEDCYIGDETSVYWYAFISLPHMHFFPYASVPRSNANRFFSILRSFPEHLNDV